MPYYLDCGNCRYPVSLSRERYEKHRRDGTLPICRTNGCYRYVKRCVKAGTDRVPRGMLPTHVNGVYLKLGHGQRGHQAAPLANSSVRKFEIVTYDSGE